MRALASQQEAEDLPQQLALAARTQQIAEARMTLATSRLMIAAPIHELHKN
jgi:hypothetical protein